MILAIVQGITEWFPISSSGHLVIVSEALPILLDEDVRVVLAVVLHVGTLFAVLTVFWKDVLEIVKAFVRLDFKTEEGKLALFIVLGSVPTALIGFFFNSIFRSLFYNLLAVGVALFVTGFTLLISERRKSNRELNYLDSLLIGIAQGIAIIPGISRSGVTIATGLVRRVKKEKAFRYSFLLSVPAVVGATIMESGDLIIGSLNEGAFLIGGAIVSMIIGYISLKLLQKIVMNEKFHLFAYYCWLVGTITIVLHLFQ